MTRTATSEKTTFDVNFSRISVPTRDAVVSRVESSTLSDARCFASRRDSIWRRKWRCGLSRDARDSPSIE